MPDLLVNLLNLPDLEPFVDGLNHVGVRVRRARPFEITPVGEFTQGGI